MPKIEIASTTSTAPCSNALSPFIISGIDSFLQDLIDISKGEIVVGDTAQVASSLVLLSVDRNTRLQQRVSGHVQAYAQTKCSPLGQCEHLEVIGSYAFQDQLCQHKSPRAAAGRGRTVPSQGCRIVA